MELTKFLLKQKKRSLTQYIVSKTYPKYKAQPVKRVSIPKANCKLSLRHSYH